MRGYSAIALHSPKNAINIGGVLRAAGCYGSSLVVVSGRRYQKQASDTQKAWRHIPMMQVDELKDAIPYGCIPVAVDLIPGAVSLPGYKHPERAFYVFGPEDGTLGEKTLSWCRDVISVPTRQCMNLAATVNVILYDRLAKQQAKKAA